MKEIVFNHHNLKDDEINRVINRVKVLLINKNNDLLIGYSGGTYQFIGGHMEDNETYIDCINREIKEESGIELKLTSIEPFMSLKHYTPNYHGSDDNVVNGIYYFLVPYDGDYDLSKTNYTEDEKRRNFTLKYINLDNIEKTLIDNIPNSKENEVLVKEMIEVIVELKSNILKTM